MSHLSIRQANKVENWVLALILWYFGARDFSFIFLPSMDDEDFDETDDIPPPKLPSFSDDFEEA